MTSSVQAQGGGGVLDLDQAFFVSQADLRFKKSNEEGDRFGAALAVGDFDGNGFEDVAAGAPGDRKGRSRAVRSNGTDPQTGGVAIFLGSESGLQKNSFITQRAARERDETGDQFGAALTVGDFNFDGFEDLAVGAPGKSVDGGPRAGAVYVFLGGLRGITRGTVITEQDAGGLSEEGDEFGFAMATGDVNGDSFEDLIVGAPGDAPNGGPRSGAVYIFLGSHIGITTGISLSQDDVVGEVSEEGDRFGAAVETGQFNGFGGVDVGDGFADLAVGAPGEAPGSDPKSGAVFLFLGARVGLGTTPGFILTQADGGGVNEEGDLFGIELGVGDTNNDGVEELGVGAPGKNGGAGAVTLFVADPTLGITTGFTLTQADSGGVDEPGDEFGAAIAFGVLDQNMFEELVVGAPGEDGDMGAVSVFPGGPNGVSTGFIISEADAGGVDEPGDRFGATLVIEDFNDNNAADVAVGAPFDSPNGDPHAGAVFVFPGLPAAPPMTDQESAAGLNERGDRFGEVMAHGDFDGDGFEDLAVAAPGEDRRSGAVFVYRGSAAGGTGIATGVFLTEFDGGGRMRLWDTFGAALGVADFNGDGYDDLAVGTPGENRRSGVVYVFPGSATGLRSGFFISETQAGDPNKPNERFGSAVAGGDFNGDGFDDLVVGAPYEDRRSGAIFVYPGSPGGVRLGFALTQAEAGEISESGDQFGAALAVGDFDGDNLEDLAVGAIGENQRSGAVFVFPGTGGGLRTGFFVTQTSAGGENGSGDLFGSALATGDFDGDGFDDMAAGAPGKLRRSGAVAVFPGSASGIRLGRTLTAANAGHNGVPWERFGTSLSAGDTNDNGFDDLVVGAPGGRPVRRILSGMVFVFPGAEQGLNKGFTVGQAGNGGTDESRDEYGASVSVADFDADGIADLAVGAPGESPPRARSAGAMYLVDDQELERLWDEFVRLQGTNDPLPPLP